ncbi:MAG: DNA alkylation repair protein [Candidatus Poribacteria bacterium]|nr:DNA alkylation repair protein [Candidatus Poribacteria bacterium]MDE0506177.1 DNA alkylation repair protein [Candidatus Poribacteria bacterium]
MTLQDVLQELESLGTAQNRKVYRRHGACENLYGVSFANLRKMAKQLKIDHSLAQQLWSTSNHEAQLLASMIADPETAEESLVDRWITELADRIVTSEFTVFVSKTPYFHAKTGEWLDSEEEWIGRAGWQLLALLAMNDESTPDSYFENYLGIIEREIHTRQNMVRDAMNSALIAIGIRNPALEKKALSAAKTIGKVEVDHGETSCKTPDAAEYIRKTVARKKQRKKR